MKNVLIVGASLSGNADGLAMFDTFLEDMQEQMSHINYTVLCKYPKDDVPRCKKRGMRAYSFTTVYQAVVGIPFFFVGMILKKIGLKPLIKMMPDSVRAYFNNDVMVDLTGISFSDDRPISSLIINTLWFLPAKVSGIPTIKIANTMGPFNKWYVRRVGRWVLKDVTVLIARGDISYNLTKELLPQRKIYNLPDIAFGLKPAKSDEIKKILDRYSIEVGNYVVIGPSYVVNGLAGQERNMKTYVVAVQEILKRFPTVKILLVPHSRAHSATIGVDSSSDDYTVCQKLQSELVKKGIDSDIIKERLDAHVLKGIIGNSMFVVGSRYHLLIAGLSSGVPCLAFGWNHKYEEAFDMFDCGEYVIRYEQFEDKTIKEKVTHFMNNISEIERIIKERLPKVQMQAKNNAKLVCEVIRSIKEYNE